MAGARMLFEPIDFAVPVYGFPYRRNNWHLFLELSSVLIFLCDTNSIHENTFIIFSTGMFINFL